LAETSALAPVYFAVTVTEGGTISGNWVMGNFNKAKTPIKTMIIDITSESTFRLINISTIFYFFVVDEGFILIV
jgi:hypothetical protein